MKSKKILFLTPRLPYPLIGGDRLKPFRTLAHLSSNHNVTLLSFYQGGIPPKSYVNAIKDMGIEVLTVPLHPLRTGFRTLLRMLGKKPLEILYYTQPEFKKELEKLLQNKEFDIAFAFFMRTAEYLKDLNIKKILMAEDCRTLYQLRSYEQSHSLKQKLIRKWEWNKLRKYEPEIVNHFDITTLVTDEDIDCMKVQNPNAKYRLMSNGTDIDYFVPPSAENRHNILFSGKLDVWANQIMLKKIINEIIPIIKKAIPDVKLDIVGAKPPNSVLSYKCSDIHVHSDVPDMLPYLQNAKLFLHPHHGGTGIQNKLLEAMSAGCPVVTTPTGNQGINGIHEEHLMLGETSEELAKHTIRVLNDTQLAKRLSVNGRDLICESHSWQAVYQSIDNIISELTGDSK